MSLIVNMFLRVLSIFYQIAIIIWDLYWRVAGKVKLPCKVISVGNITAGGAGKTPVVISLAEMAVKSGYRTAVAAKGYKRLRMGLIEVRERSTWQEVGDEPLEIFNLTENVRVYVHESKTIAAQKACDDGAEVIIIDDGFQHRKLHRDIDIVCLDWHDPLGSGSLLPRGLLREPKKNLNRADIILFTSYDTEGDYDLDFDPEQEILYARSQITGFLNVKTKTIERSDSIKIRKVFAFCGLAKPSKFETGLKEIGCAPVGLKAFPDHYHYTQDDFDNLIELAKAENAACLITTYKDAVKIDGFDFGDFNVYSAMLNVSFVDKSGKDQTEKLKELLRL